jgi:hypothetical protein
LPGTSTPVPAIKITLKNIRNVRTTSSYISSSLFLIKCNYSRKAKPTFDSLLILINYELYV